MTLGRLAAVTLSATTNTLIHTVPVNSGIFQATVNIVNLNASDVSIRLAIVDGGVSDLVTADWIEYDTTVRLNGGILRSTIELKPGQSVVGYSDTSNVNMAVWA